MQSGGTTRAWWLVMLGLALLATSTSAADARGLPEADDEYQPGLVGTYVAGGQTIERIDPDIAFDWKTAAPAAPG